MASAVIYGIGYWYEIIIWFNNYSNSIKKINGVTIINAMVEQNNDDKQWCISMLNNDMVC